MPKDIRKLNLDELTQYFVGVNEKAFRAKQVWEWLWVKAAGNFDDMTNLSQELRVRLKADFEIRKIRLDEHQNSNDGTIKSAFKLFDDEIIEGVLIPADDRMTACVSSQVGCSLSCKFCATGYMDRKRNLEPGEIYDQVVAIDQQAKDTFQHPLTNIVFMGMGEPLLNYKNVIEGIDRITAPDGLNMSPKRITVSTAGIAKMIKKLADDDVRFNLAISLHAANDLKRNQIMPINESNTLEALEEALMYFYNKTKNRITFEYIVFNNFNDTLEDAKELWQFAKKIPSKINIIEYNPISEADYQNTDADKLDLFARFLEGRGLTVNVRRSRGKDIDAACGQLANKHKEKVA
jgi:23S rRNA (adenine2503-C2)-methyltransferase